MFSVAQPLSPAVPEAIVFPPWVTVKLTPGIPLPPLQNKPQSVTLHPLVHLHAPLHPILPSEKTPLSRFRPASNRRKPPARCLDGLGRQNRESPTSVLTARLFLSSAHDSELSRYSHGRILFGVANDLDRFGR